MFASIAFDPAAGTSVFVVPEVVVGRRDGVGWVTTVGDVDPARRPRPPPEHPDDGPAPRLRYADGALDPATWCAAVATAVERIGAGELAKVVLARDLLVSADVPLDPRRLLRRLADRFPDCWTFAVDGLLGATPELLLRRSGRQLSARVLAGTAPAGRGRRRRAAGRGAASARPRTAPSTRSPSTRWSGRSSRTARRSTAPAEPDLLTLANVRHLASDVTGTQRRTRRARRGPGCWSWSAPCTPRRPSAAPRPRTPPP